jgi:hypothetical protein
MRPETAQSFDLSPLVASDRSHLTFCASCVSVPLADTLGLKGKNKRKTMPMDSKKKILIAPVVLAACGICCGLLFLAIFSAETEAEANYVRSLLFPPLFRSFLPFFSLSC